MPDTPPFGIRFRYLPPDDAVPPQETAPSDEPGVAERHDRVPVYRQALAFTAHVHEVIELAAESERYFLRDQLDRKSAIIPQLVAQGLATADMAVRRALYVRARQALTDCAAILDMLLERRTVKPSAVEPARALALDLLDKLLELTAPPPRLW
jgi:hypothetical protein